MVLWECFEYPFVSAFVWRACVCARFDSIFPILMRQTNAIHLIFVHILITHCNFLICAMDWHRICCTHKKVYKTFGTNCLAHILQSNSWIHALGAVKNDYENKNRTQHKHACHMNGYCWILHSFSTARSPFCYSVTVTVTVYLSFRVSLDLSSARQKDKSSQANFPPHHKFLAINNIFMSFTTHMFAPESSHSLSLHH